MRLGLAAVASVAVSYTHLSQRRLWTSSKVAWPDDMSLNFGRKSEPQRQRPISLPLGYRLRGGADGLTLVHENGCIQPLCCDDFLKWPPMWPPDLSDGGEQGRLDEGELARVQQPSKVDTLSSTPAPLYAMSHRCFWLRLARRKMTK